MSSGARSSSTTRWPKPTRPRGQVYRAERDWLAEEASYRRAIELNPNYPTAHQWYATHLTARGRFDEALHQIRLAEELDPLSHAISATVAVVLFFARVYESCEVQLKKCLELEPSFASTHAWLGVLYSQIGRHAEAGRASERAYQLPPDNPNVLTGMGHSYAATGERDKALEIVRQSAERGAVGWTALVYQLPGDEDEACAILERSFDEPDSWDALFYSKVDPWTERLRDNPRLAALMDRMNFPE